MGSIVGGRLASTTDKVKLLTTGAEWPSFAVTVIVTGPN